MIKRLSTSNFKPTIIFVGKLILFSMVFVLVFELFLRTIMPPLDKINSKRDPEWNIELFAESERNQDYFFAKGKINQIQSRVRINNYGWSSAVDYYTKDKRNPNKKLIAIIGDSYLEGMYVSPQENFGQVLDSLLGDSIEIYTFGRSGAGIAHYSAICRYVEMVFEPDMYLFMMRDGTIKVSNATNRRLSSIPQYDCINGEIKELERASSSFSSLNSFLTKKFYTLRYGIANYDILNLIRSRLKFSSFSQPVKEIGDEKCQLINNKIFYSELQKIESILNKKPYIFIHDANRKVIYGEEDYIQDEYYIQLEYLTKNTTYNLTTWFSDSYKKDSIQFNFETDFHWNAHGNKIVAEAIYYYLIHNDNSII